MRLIERRIIINYSGVFKFDTIETLIDKAKREMEALNTETVVKKKVINVMVECLENMYKHSDLVDQNALLSSNYSSKFAFELEDDEYIISTGNPILNKNIDTLRRKIEQVNDLDKPGLKKLYEQVITNTTISVKGGASLGIIDIALKSGNKIYYFFEPVNDEISYYVLQIKIAKSISKNNKS